ncbi:MAG: hypothetical protein Q8807_02400 ['Waltheria sp.' little leaf phytoplasma]|nr:hypothetical protein ['Waltheria sp.' little leaf phytoplasma]MDV3166511.1 hypothetical protein ['Waltheria sp.' little leaf phytoplasma]
MFFWCTSSKVWAYTDDMIYERDIRGTKIIHVPLGENATETTVKSYIQKYINPSFDNNVSNKPSYNASRDDSIYWYIKDADDELLAVYFDGQTRKNRDNFYDFIELRWIGNGSPHMYCFWKFTTENKNPLEKKEILHLKHFNDIYYHSRLTKLFVGKILKKTLKKTVKKVPKGGSVGQIVFGISENLIVEQIINLILTGIESNPQVLTTASELIYQIEKVAMGINEKFDGTKLGNAISVGANILKGAEEVISFPTEAVKKVGKDMEAGFDQIVNSTDGLEALTGVGKIIAAPVTGIVNTGVETVQNVSYYAMDMFEKFGNFFGF